MQFTVEIKTEKLNNKTLFQVTDECTKQGLNTRDVKTILIWEGVKLNKFRFCWDVNGKIIGMCKKSI
jgi:hypothetical protein